MGTTSEGGGPGAALVAAIRATVPAVRLLTDEIDRESYRSDETAYLEAGLPLAVALPTTTEEVAALVLLAAELICYAVALLRWRRCPPPHCSCHNSGDRD